MEVRGARGQWGSNRLRPEAVTGIDWTRQMKGSGQRVRAGPPVDT